MVSSKSAATKKSCPMDMSLPTPAPSVVSHNGCGQTQIALSILLVLSYMPMPGKYYIVVKATTKRSFLSGELVIRGHPYYLAIFCVRQSRSRADNNANLLYDTVTAYKPGFISPLENITVAAGRLAQFTCVVKHLGGHKVKT